MHLKEKISKRVWIGLIGCMAGAFIISYVPPSGDTSDLFYLGILCAVIAAFGWAGEGVLVTSAMDFVEPTVALNIYQIVSTTFFVVILVPLSLFLTVPVEHASFSTIFTLLGSSGIKYIMFAGCLGSFSYMCWYKAMNTTGVSRAMALNITYALWGIILSVVFIDEKITLALIIGALCIFAGMVLVIGNPKDLVNLRKTD